MGIEYILRIYFDSKRLGEWARNEERMPSSEGIRERKRIEVISEYCSAGGRKGLPPFGNRALLETLLDLHPGKDYEPAEIEIITSVTEPESEWLSEKDIMKYINEHPVLPEKPAS